MGIEIERRFLVSETKAVTALFDTRSGEPLWPNDRYRQGYISFDPVVRVRLAGTKDAFLTIKGGGQLKRAEFEYQIPPVDALDLLQLSQAVIYKTRHQVSYGDHVWHVDRFHMQLTGLWLAEIELDEPTETFERPPWLGDEVTYDSRYANVNLAQLSLSDASTIALG